MWPILRTVSFDLGWQSFVSTKIIDRLMRKIWFCFSSSPNNRIINVSGGLVVRSMEYEALKLIRESTDFVRFIFVRDTIVL